jgi:hypothetical protein
MGTDRMTTQIEHEQQHIASLMAHRLARTATSLDIG